MWTYKIYSENGIENWIESERVIPIIELLGKVTYNLYPVTSITIIYTKG